MEITVIGGGLAGVEAASRITRMGGRVVLFEMRPAVTTPAHRTDYLAELVCSNSLKSKELSNAHGLLKEEMRVLSSVVIDAADASAIPGGKALVVDRERFAKRLTEMVENDRNVRLVREEMRVIPGGDVIIATGPLTSGALASGIMGLTGEENLSFFDSISPIIDAKSVDPERSFYASRYSKETGGDYLNCPLTREEYDVFYDALTGAERVDLRDFEKTSYFEGCLPVEILAERGRKTLAFGPMKPVGLVDPVSGRRPHAVLQLRKENASGSMLNMVGFQTKMKYPEQERVFRMIPALKDAVFLRYGSIHRNSYINAPVTINGGLQSKTEPRVFFAGQLTGVEGYVESTAMGLMAGLSAFMRAGGKEFQPPPPTTCVGALIRYLTTENKHFQPMNINFGLLEGYSKKNKDAVIETALKDITEWKNTFL